MFQLKRELWLPQGIDQIFAFFSDASNLSLITPEWVRFTIKTEMPIQMKEGTLIDYSIRIRFVPVNWRTKITVWEPPYRFVDEQLRGPYRTWIHEHIFQEKDGGTLVIDNVQYAVFGGGLINHLFVRNDLETIFAFREAKLRELFLTKRNG